MSPNKDRPHVLVLPEDDANGQLANGFHLQVDWTRQRQMQVLPPAGGWARVMEDFLANHVVAMDRYPDRFMILLMDCDSNEERLPLARARVPARLAERVFILGSMTKPEALKADLGSYEEIGSSMAGDCFAQTNETWGHELLQHNAGELDRLRENLCPILFPPA